MKITIDVEEDVMEYLRNKAVFEYPKDNYEYVHKMQTITVKALQAYEAEKNKIQVGDWARTHDNRVFKVSHIDNELMAHDSTGMYQYAYDSLKKLSPEAQAILNKEIK